MYMQENRTQTVLMGGRIQFNYSGKYAVNVAKWKGT